MSTYEAYDSTSLNYDNGRRPVGIQIYHGFLATHFKKPVSELHLLDAGCGTGNYAEYLLRHGLGKVTMIDASQGMLKAARAKVQKYANEGRVNEIREAFLPTIPYGDNTFDAVMINFVLHHLEDGSDPTFQNNADTFKEVYRVLKPGGLLLFQTHSPYQFKECIWLYNIMTERAKNSFVSRVATIEQHKQFIKDAGFNSPPFIYAPTEEKLLCDEVYFDYEGLAKQEWRNQLSCYSLQSPEETQEMVNKMKKMKAEGTFQDYVARCEEKRYNSGWATLLITSKHEASNGASDGSAHKNGV